MLLPATTIYLHRTIDMRCRGMRRKHSVSPCYAFQRLRVTSSSPPMCFFVPLFAFLTAVAAANQSAKGLSPLDAKAELQQHALNNSNVAGYLGLPATQRADGVSKSIAVATSQHDSQYDGNERSDPSLNGDRPRSRALRSILSDMEESAMRLPRIMDDMLESVLSSLDRASGGLLSGLADSRVEYGYSKDRTRLIVRLHLPQPQEDNGQAAPRELHVRVLGKAHLQMKMEIKSGTLTSTSQHTIPLPARVAKDGMEINRNSDGTVDISLRILKGDEGDSGSLQVASTHREATEGGFLGLPFGRSLIPALFARVADAAQEGQESTQEIPSSEVVSRCRSNYPNERLLIEKCICNGISDGESRAVCYGTFISKSVSMARRLGMDEFATSTKHIAIECASGREDKVTCLEKVARDIITSLYHRKDPSSNLTDRIRQAIESEDDGPSQFESSSGLYFAKLVVIGLFSVSLFWIMALCLYRRDAIGVGSMESFHRLSSVLSQGAGSPADCSTSTKGLTGRVRGVRNPKTGPNAIDGQDSKIA